MIFSTLTLSGIAVVVLRDDLNHPIVSGNKLHKLSPNIALAKARNCSTILSFGGPYSNHLHALAWACKEAGLSSIGVVRGELHDTLTPTLKDCRAWEMKLIASPRKDYREYQKLLSNYQEPRRISELPLNSFLSGFEGDPLLIPEGGSNSLAIKSLGLVYEDAFNQEQHQDITHVVCATGTGATIAGVYEATPNNINVIGMQAVAEDSATLTRIHQWLSSKPDRLTIEQSHLGGFGKIPASLINFIENFEAQHGIPLDPIYNGKAMLKLSQMIDAAYFQTTDKILFIHTGGLQGKRSLSK